jgi:hypothetical protein
MFNLNSDNCMVCGKEYLTKELRFIIACNFKLCDSCLAMSDPANDYNQVKKILSGYLKLSQVVSDPELASPDIKIEPVESNIQKAVDMLKKINPNYFVGVRKIIVDTGTGFGHVSSGPGQDPSVIHINLTKIKNEIQNKFRYASKEQQDKEFIRQIALTISHERRHQISYTPNLGFSSESEAESEVESMLPKIDKYFNNLK